MSAPSTNRDRRVASLTKRVIELEARLDAREGDRRVEDVIELVGLFAERLDRFDEKLDALARAVVERLLDTTHAQGGRSSRARAPRERGRHGSAE